MRELSLKSNIILAAVGVAAFAPVSISASPVVIDFEDLVGMTFFVGNPVPQESQLSDHYLNSLGVRFSSGDPYVAVVAMGLGHATSGINGLAGTDGNGLNTGVAPIAAAFFDPSNPSTRAVTDYVSLRGDLWGGGPPISLIAYGMDGNVLATDTKQDIGGATLTVSTPGIHSVRYINNGSVGIDDFTFNAPVAVAVPEPSTFALVGLAMTGLCFSRRAGRS